MMMNEKNVFAALIFAALFRIMLHPIQSAARPKEFYQVNVTQCEEAESAITNGAIQTIVTVDLDHNGMLEEVLFYDHEATENLDTQEKQLYGVIKNAEEIILEFPIGDAFWEDDFFAYAVVDKYVWTISENESILVVKTCQKQRTAFLYCIGQLHFFLLHGPTPSVSPLLTVDGGYVYSRGGHGGPGENDSIVTLQYVETQHERYFVYHKKGWVTEPIWDNEQNYVGEETHTTITTYKLYYHPEQKTFEQRDEVIDTQEKQIFF